MTYFNFTPYMSPSAIITEIIVKLDNELGKGCANCKTRFPKLPEYFKIKKQIL